MPKHKDTSKALCRLSERPLTPDEVISVRCAADKIEKLRQDGLPGYLLQNAMQKVFLESLKCGAFNGDRWRDPLNSESGEPHCAELLRYAKDKGYVNWKSDEATYKGVIDEAAGQLIELLRQEAAARPDQRQVSMTTPKKPIPQAIPVPLPQTVPELLAYIHNHVNAILGETRAFKFLPAGMTPEQYLGLRRNVIVVECKVIADGLLELERTGFAVSDHWREWLPRPEVQGQTRMSSQPVYLWPLANYDDVCRLEVQVELAIKALTDGGLPPSRPMLPLPPRGSEAAPARVGIPSRAKIRNSPKNSRKAARPTRRMLPRGD